MKKRKPKWLKIKFQDGEEYKEVNHILNNLSLNTVCEEASCPNRMECFSRKTATFMIMGNICTRDCKFCGVNNGNPQELNLKEPAHIAKAVLDMELKHVVITSVTRDDLSDGGAGHFAKVIKEIKKTSPQVTIEVLIPDLQGDLSSLKKIVEAKAEIINHNIETVPSLYQKVRPEAEYQRSLQLLANVKKLNKDILTKSGIMLGLGETKEEVIQVLNDLRDINCDLLTLGQYLPPTKEHYPLEEYVHPDIFASYKEIGEKMGFKHVASGPLVRSSYQAEQVFKT